MKSSVDKGFFVKGNSVPKKNDQSENCGHLLSEYLHVSMLLLCVSFTSSWVSENALLSSPPLCCSSLDNNDTPSVIPYPGELYILNKLLDAIIDVNGEQSVEDHQKLFMVRIVFSV